MAPTRTIFAWMLREEWRLHARLFGGARFAAFPLLVTALVAGAVWALVTTGTPVGDVVAGVHLLVLGFGLHTGSVGLLGRDAIRGVLGDLTLLVFSGRTLPLSRRRLLAVFLVKDVVYYAALFLLPLSVAFVPVALTGHEVAVVRLFPALVATFVLGVSLTLVGIALSARGAPAWVLGLAAVAAAAGAWAAGYDPLRATPYALYRAPLSVAAAGSLALTAALAAAGAWGADPTVTRPARTTAARFDAWRTRLGDDDGMLAKSLLDVARSSGGLWKVPFSAGVLFAVAAFAVGAVDAVTGVEPSNGVAFGALLGLTGFTTYNWLTQFDSVGAYAALPVGTPALFRAKFRAFLLLGLPTAVAGVALAVALFGARPAEAAAGFALAVGVALYLFGVTVRLTGLSPNEFLFDTGLFAAFTAAVALPLVPVLVVGFVVVPVPPAGLAGLTAAGALLGAAGVLLYRRAVPAWTARYRNPAD